MTHQNYINQETLSLYSFYIYIYAFSRRFYPKWLTVHSGYNIFLSVHVFPGNRIHNLCAANAMLYHWATGTLLKSWFIITTLSDKINIHLTYTKKRLYAVVLATVLCHSAHCLHRSNKLSILTDKLCSYLKVQTASKRQVLGNAI